MIFTIKTPGKNQARKKVTGFCVDPSLFLIKTSVSSPVSRSFVCSERFDRIDFLQRRKNVFTCDRRNFVFHSKSYRISSRKRNDFSNQINSPTSAGDGIMAKRQIIAQQTRRTAQTKNGYS